MKANVIALLLILGVSSAIAKEPPVTTASSIQSTKLYVYCANGIQYHTDALYRPTYNRVARTGNGEPIRCTEMSIYKFHVSETGEEIVTKIK